MRVCIAVLIAGGLLGGCSYLNQKLGMADDNIIEEAIENKIEEHTGLNIDLSPDSEER